LFVCLHTLTIRLFIARNLLLFGHCDKLPTTILFLDTKSFVIRAGTIMLSLIASASHYNPIQRPKTHAYTRHHLPDRVAHDAY
jgi:hypothetical protein